MNLPPFYSGQKVVSLKDWSDAPITKGMELVVREIKKAKCGCWVMDIGINKHRGCSPTQYCAFHNMKSVVKGYNWFGTKHFAPIESQFHSITFEQVVEIESPLISMS